MEPVLFVAAFALGFGAWAVGLPPLVGYLLAGFVLHEFGFESTAGVEAVSDLGILLLLFGIGLKLRLSSLVQPRVWGTTLTMSAIGTAGIAVLLLGLGSLGLPFARDLDAGQLLIVGFALSFSSTVFAVKTLEVRSETSSLAGQVSVGVLIIQDLLAVGFLAIVAGARPSIWAIPLVIGLVVGRPLLGWILDRAGHGELQVLLGFTLAVAIGVGGFAEVGLKADLGALVAGLLLSSHDRSEQLADRLLGFKDLFLVGFFLSIGLGGAPSPGAWLLGAGLAVLAIVRGAGYVWLFTRFRLRARTAFHAAVVLATYSEFGLIVAAAALDGGHLDERWQSIIAVAVAISFVLAAAVAPRRYRLFDRWSGRLNRLEREPITEDDKVLDCGFAKVLVFGMGRVGTGAFDELVVRRGPVVVGVERSEEVVAAHDQAGRAVVRGDALDHDFWERVRFHPEVELVVAAMSNHNANLECVRRIRESLPSARIAAIAGFPDQVAALREAGVDVARNLYEEAGQGLADDAVSVVYEPPEG